MATAPWYASLDQQPPAGFGYPSWLAQYDGPQARNDPFAQFQASRANAQQMTDPLAQGGEAMPDAFNPPLIGETLDPNKPNQVITRSGATQDRRASAVGSTGIPSATPVDRTGGQATAAPARQPGGYDWLYDVQPGQQYTEGQGWKVTGPVQAGQWIAPGLGLAVNYDPSREVARNNGPNGMAETPMRRAFRIAADMLNSGQTTDLQGAVNFGMAQVTSDARRDGTANGLGWDPAGFRPLAFGEKYNPEINYVGGGGSTYTGGGTPAPQAPQAAAPAAQQTGGNTVSGLSGYGGGSGGGGQRTNPQALGGETNQGTSHQGGPFGAIPDFDPTFAFQAAANSPSVAAQYLRAANGQTGPSLSRMSKFRDNLYGKALQAYLSLAGLNGNAGGAQGITDFISTLNGGGDIMSLINPQAGNVAGMNMGGLSDPTIEEALRAATALSSLNLGSVAGSGLSDQLDNLLYDQQMKGILSNGLDISNLGGQFSGSPYQKALAAYTGMQGR